MADINSNSVLGKLADDPPIDIHHLGSSTLHWLSRHGLEIAIAAGVAVGIYLLLSATKSVGKRLKNKEGDQLGLTTVIARAVARTGQLFMVMVSARLVAGYTDPPAILLRTVQFLFTITAVFQGAIWAREIILGLIERRTEDGSAGDTLTNAMGIIRLLVTVALFSVAAIMVLDNLGVNVTGLIAGLGIGGIAIGLAAQGIFSDLFAALSIIFDKPFRKGEQIQYDRTTAVVDHIGLKSTRLSALTGEKKIISNANLLQKEITSYAHLDHRRVKFAIGIIYQTDPDKAARIPDMLKAIVEAHGGRFIRSGFINFGQSSLDFEVDFEVHNPSWEEIYQIRHRIGLAILKTFNEQGLEFAYPTQTTFTAAPDGRMVMPYAEPQPGGR